MGVLPGSGPRLDSLISENVIRIEEDGMGDRASASLNQVKLDPFNIWQPQILSILKITVEEHIRPAYDRFMETINMKKVAEASEKTT